MSAQTWWLHVLASAGVTLLVCHRRRGREAIEAIDVLGYQGVIVHDGLASYDYLDDAEHAPWRDVADVERATAQWVGWWNHARLHGSCDRLTPVEYEAAWYRRQQDEAA